MIKKISISLICGFLALIYIAQHDAWVHEQLTRIISHQLTYALDCQAKCTVRSVNFFAGEILLDNLHMHSHAPDQWHWHSTQCKANFSWWQLILHRQLSIDITLNECKATSALANGNLAIAPHILYFLSAPLVPIPLFLNMIVLNNCSLTAHDAHNQITSSVNFTLYSYQKDENTMNINCKLTEGYTHVGERTVYHTLTGTIAAVIDFIHNTQTADINCTTLLPQCAEPLCTITGTWQHGRGHFTAHNADQKIMIDPVTIIPTKNGLWINAMGKIPCTYLWNVATNMSTPSPITGTAMWMIRGSLNAHSPITGHCVIQNMHYNSIPLCNQFSVSGTHIGTTFTGTVNAHTNGATVEGSWHYNQHNNIGSCTVTNSTPVTIPGLPDWTVQPNACTVNLTCDKHNTITAQYAGNVHNQKTNELHATQGTLTCNNNQLNAAGTINKNKYTCRAYRAPNWYLDNAMYCHENGKPLITIKNNKQQWSDISASIHYSLIRHALRTLTDYDVQGDGTLHLESIYKNNTVTANVHLENGTIRLPHTYNFINGCDAHITWNTNTQHLVADGACTLHAGTARIPRAVIIFDENRNCTFAHVPCIFERCLLNSAHDLFAMWSGNILLTKPSTSAPFLLQGHCFIDHAQLTQNLFSRDLHKRLLGNATNVWHHATTPHSPLHLDLSLETKYPIRIDTFLLAAQAGINMRIKGDVHNPLIAGTIDIQSGTILLPYKPLRITTGKLTFIPGQLHNPLVELIAKNKIKKYAITLQADGYLHNHQVTLDASPPLTEEQIVSLLLVGSEQNSLQVMMPALITQNLKMALFGSGQKSFLDTYFKHAHAPFNIHLVPRFSDQTGRGGLRGGIEIEVNEKWHALIEKNFSLSEDTRFELEYIISDEVSARAVRDERRDIGGEIEMRWKF